MTSTSLAGRWTVQGLILAALVVNAGFVLHITGVSYEPFSWQAFAQVYDNAGEPAVGDPATDPDADALKGDPRDPQFTQFDPSGCLFNLANGTIVSGGSVTASCPLCTNLLANVPKGADPMNGSLGCFTFRYRGATQVTDVVFTFDIAPPPGCKIARAACPDQGPVQTSSLIGGGEASIVVGNVPSSMLTMLPASCTTWYGQITFDARDNSNVNNAVVDNNIPLDCSALCGSGVIDDNVGEVCDDRNGVSGDGCDENCSRVETGFECPTPGRPCNAICGDNLIVGDEECDDGNSVGGDGCSASCRLEAAAAPMFGSIGLAMLALALLAVGLLSARSRRRPAL
jgi:cysteine-rich repeat protein